MDIQNIDPNSYQFYQSYSQEELYFLLTNPQYLKAIDLYSVLSNYHCFESQIINKNEDQLKFLSKLVTDVLRLAKKENIAVTGARFALRWIIDQHSREELTEFFNPTEVFQTLCDNCDDDDVHELDYEFYQIVDPHIDFNNIWIVKRFFKNEENSPWYQEFLGHIWDKSTNQEVLHWVVENQHKIAQQYNRFNNWDLDLRDEYAGIIEKIEDQQFVTKIFQEGIDRNDYVLAKIEDQNLLYNICIGFDQYYPRASFVLIDIFVQVFMTCLNKLRGMKKEALYLPLDILDSVIRGDDQYQKDSIEHFIYEWKGDHIQYSYSKFRSDLIDIITNVLEMLPENAIYRWPGFTEILLPIISDEEWLIDFHNQSWSFYFRELARKFIRDQSKVRLSLEDFSETNW